MRKSFSALIKGCGVYFPLLFIFTSYYSFAQCPAGSISGQVYLDFNVNGIIDSDETGHPGVLVRVFNQAGVQVSQTATSSSGQFSISGLANNTSYRLDFDSGSYDVSTLGPDNRSETQFVTTPYCTANLGLADGSGGCSSETEVFLTCFVNGKGDNSPDQETIIGLKSSFNSASPASVYATQAETGAIWGLAYDQNESRLFSSAFVKQHASLGPNGIGAIYMTDLSGSSPVTSLFADVIGLGQNVGNLASSNSDDCVYGTVVGKVGLGAMVLDDAGSYLYVANLSNNSVIKINTNDTRAATTSSIAIPDPGCGDYRVFALKYYEGKLYVGATCTGESTSNENQTSIHVYELSTSTAGSSLVFSSNYSSGYWSDNKISAKLKMQWLTDIEFTTDGNMVLGLSDRIGHSFCDGGTSRIDDQYGDILMAYKSGSNWILENNGTAGSLSGTGIGNGEGPGGGEFFGDDFYPGDAALHPDVAIGSIYIRPGSDEVISAVYDPAYSAYSGGLHRYNTQTGSKVASKELYNQNISDYFGKATGFGDITAGCGPDLPQIGNYVWMDTDCDGIQDAGEGPLAFASLDLYDTNCNLIGTTVTDSEGQYAFNATNGLNGPGTYYVVLEKDAFVQSANYYDFGGVFHYPTISSGTADLNSDLGISATCNELAGIPHVIVTAVAGNNTTFDIGLKVTSEFDLALMKVNTTPNRNRKDDLIEFGITVYNQGTVTAKQFEIVDYLTSAYEFDSSDNPGWVLQGDIAKYVYNTDLLPGDQVMIPIKLKLVETDDLSKLVNIAEISATLDANGNINSDVDSTVDEDATNDAGGDIASSTDDKLDGDGVDDEDDHDPAMVYIADLALSKVLRDLRAYDVGETVIFDINVSNQGNVDISSFDVVDEFPSSLIFDLASNPGWSIVNGSMVKYTNNNELAAGSTTTISIRFKISADAIETDLMNYAEISGFVAADASITTDFDSTPDTDTSNDNGTYLATNDLISDHGYVDEDDHDPEIVRLRSIDLALIKTTEKTTYNLGDEVVFEIEVHNQGSTVIKKVMLIDYLPSGMTLNDDSWSLDGSGTQASKEIVFLSGLQPGDVITETITLQLSATGHYGAYINHAEIGEVYDMDNNDVSSSDRDSKADNIFGNDNGGQAVSAMDDYLLGDGIDDEDDEDPALIFVPFIQHNNTCICLNNATDAYDGQFRDSIKITSIPGENWVVDNSYNFTQVGPIRERAASADSSWYFLRGDFTEGTYYSVRVTNGDGIYLQIEGGGCDYCEPIVSSEGLGAVCANSTHTYDVDLSDPKYADCVGFSWFLSDGPAAGNTIVNLPGTNATGSGTGMTGSGTGLHQSITIKWGATAGSYDLVLYPHCPNDCVSPVVLPIQVGLDDSAMSCVHELNVSLNHGCMSTLEPSDLLTSEMISSVAYQLILTDAYGDVIQNNKLTEEHLWTQVMAKVMNPCSGNSCWAFVNVEDKLPPEIQCDDIELACWQAQTYEPIVIDNCSHAEYTLVSETTTTVPCSSPYIKEIHRTYTAVDGYGNVSAPCTQTIKLLELDTTDILRLPNFLVSEGTNLACDNLVLNEEGYPDISMTGVPQVGTFGQTLYPVEDLYCNIGVDYSDFLVNDFGCSKKIMRTWTIYDGCNEPWRRVQTIEIGDNRAPWVTCPTSVEIDTDGTPDCQAEYLFELPEITDDCTTTGFEVDVAYPGGFIDNMTQATSATFSTLDSTSVTYTVYDNCGNSSSCSFNVLISDNVTPTAVCDRNSVVSLRSNGTAKAFPETFDDGSYDDCSLYKLLVRRMDSSCECDRPEFDDLHYLGSRTGRFYYLTSYKRPCSKAFSYAEALGGQLLTLESEGEHDWVHEQVNAYLPGTEYFIGLKDKRNNGEFTWGNHLEPSFNKWLDGEPIGEGQCVKVDENGNWVVVDDELVRFVVELSDPCGFSNAVEFCCADAGPESHMVVLRAIDYFGQYNDCMVNVEVQDKVAPTIDCPDNVQLPCATPVDLNSLAVYGDATASDSCVVDITMEVIDETDQCGLGRIIRRFTASDATGSSQCDQVISFFNDEQYDFDSTIWPEDFETNLGCNFGSLHPDSLAVEFAYPIYPTDVCDLVEGTFEDQVFSFTGTAADACMKIRRRWTVIDWCQTDEFGFPLSKSYDQTIKVNDEMGPEILTEDCGDLTVFTDDCEFAEVVFEVRGTDECTPSEKMQSCIRIDIDADGSDDIIDCFVSDVVGFNNKLSVGHHIAYVSFNDLCGNTTTCAKQIWVKNEKPPVAYCKDGISVGLEPMDFDGDGIPDDEMACIFPHMLDAGSFHPCGNIVGVSFCENDTTNKITYSCCDIGVDTVTLCVIDEFGNKATCNTRVEVQDNNGITACPTFDLALIKQIDFSVNPGPYNPGDNVTFRIIVFNQGNVDAADIEIVDYIPTGFTLNDTNWTQNGNVATLNTPIATLAAGTSTSVVVTHTIDANTMETCILNYAEISAAVNTVNSKFDRDSDYDSNPDNDVFIGENILDSAGGDEDDHDCAKIIVEQNYDLALTKSLSSSTPGPFMPESSVCFDIVVTNQGSLNASAIQVRDIIPPGLILNDPNWVLSGSDAVLVSPIPFIAPGNSVTRKITFQIDEMFMNTSICNYAEIITDNGDDVDSDPDRSIEDDEDGDGNGDDDDEDKEVIAVGQVFDLALIKTIHSSTVGSSPFPTGASLIFEICVVNQGSLDATDVEITDYVPTNLLYFDSEFNTFQGWTGTVNPTNAIGNVDVDSTECRLIELMIDPNFNGTAIVNNAEITNAENNINMPDIDSTPGDEDGTTPDADDDDLTDTDGGDDYDPADITVMCTLRPVCSVRPNLTVNLGADRCVTIMPSDIDNGSVSSCLGLDVTLSLTDDMFCCSDINTVSSTTLIVTDSQGNVTALTDPTCQTQVTVIDNVDPTIECQDVVTTLNSDGVPEVDLTFVVTASDDNCDIVDTELTLPVTIDPCAANPASVTLTDQSGNTATCSFMIFIQDQLPIAVCKDTTVCLNAMGEYVLTQADLENITEGSLDPEACGDLEIFSSQGTFRCEDVSSTAQVEVVFMVRDVNGGTANCLSRITVVDKTPPVPICTDTTLVLNVNGIVDITGIELGYQSTDACGILDLDPRTVFTCDELGSQTIVLTVTDVNNNVETRNCVVSVVDDRPPVLSCVDTYLVLLNDVPNGTYDLDDADIDAIVNVTDNCGDPNFTIDQTRFNCGDKDCSRESGTLITIIATDGSNLMDTCQVEIIVDDEVRPECEVPNFEFNISGNGLDMIGLTDLLAVTGFSYEDNCAPRFRPDSLAISPNGFDCDDVDEVITVRFDFFDDCQNFRRCTADVTIRDLSMPLCMVNAMDTVYLDATGDVRVTLEDIDNGSILGCQLDEVIYDNNWFACNNANSVEEVCVTIVLTNGLSSGPCCSDVLILDTIAPMISCVSNLTLDLDANGLASITVDDIVTTPLAARDNCPTTVTLDQTSFNCQDKTDVVIVTATVSDDSGNTATCTTDITVRDLLPPAPCLLLEDQVFNLEGSPPSITVDPNALLAPNGYMDNCGGAPASIVLTPAVFDCDDIGIQGVTVTVEDLCGNTNICTTDIEIVDVTIPTCVTQDITVNLDPDGTYTLEADEVDNGSTAGCGNALELSVSPSVFDCGDIGDNVVFLTVMTTGGATSICPATVTVTNNNPPVITCPDDVTISCSTDVSDLSIFGTATGLSSCGSVTIETLVPFFNVNTCGIGIISRGFRADDEEGLFVTCQQIITIETPMPPLAVGDITWPADTIVECVPNFMFLSTGFPQVDLSNVECSDTSLTFVTVDPTPNMGTGCDNVLERTWTLIDSCTLNTATGAGIFTHTQIITLSDLEGPTFTTCPNDVIVNLPVNFGACEAFVDLPVVLEDCSGVDVVTNDSPFSDNMGAGGNAAGTYPGGTTNVTVTATDICGNTSICNYDVTVVDMFADIESCKKIIETIQAPNDPCPPFFGIVHVDQACVVTDSECDEDAFLVSWSDTDNMDTTFMVDCNDVLIGIASYTVYLWGGNVLLDSCSSQIQVVDGSGYCDTIGCNTIIADDVVGRIRTESGEFVPTVNVSMEGADMEDEVTDIEGYYAFADLVENGVYIVSPEKDIDPLNGVSTLDLIQIQRHILGIQELDSPYKLIAADINHSGNINGIDLVELRKLILGVYSDFPENTSWRMVDEAFVFPDSRDPFVTLIPETYTIRGFADPMEIDFVGVKIGDVNNTVEPGNYNNTLDVRTSHSVRIEFEDALMQQGEVATIRLTMQELSDLDGFQFSLGVDLKRLDILDVATVMNGMSSANYHIVDNGLLNVSWNRSGSTVSVDGEAVIELTFLAHSNLWLSEAIELNRKTIRPEAYSGDEIFDLSLDGVSEKSNSEQMTLDQNLPNPWKESTAVRYTLLSPETVTFNIYGIDGVLVSSQSIDGQTGANVIMIERSDLPNPGLFYYELVAGEASLMKKMILLD